MVISNKLCIIRDNGNTVTLDIWPFFLYRASKLLITLSVCRPCYNMHADLIWHVSAALFLEFWKRYSSEVTHRWDTTNYTSEEEHPRPQYMEQLKYCDETSINFVTNTKEPKVPYWNRKVGSIFMYYPEGDLDNWI